jgi:hypothetical protein
MSPLLPRLRQRRQRGRRVLAWGLTSFLLLQLTASVLLDYAWPQVRFPFFWEQTTRPDAFAVPPTIVSFGSSRSGCLLDEDEITLVVRQLTRDPAVQFFSAATPAGDPIVADRMLDQLLARGLKPRCAVIEFCPESVNHRNNWLTLHVGRQLRWDEVPSYLGEVTITGNLLRLVGTRFLPLYAFRDQIRQHVAGRSSDWYEAFLHGPGAASRQVLTGDLTGPAADWGQLIRDSLRNTKPDPNRTTTQGLNDVRRELRQYRPGGNSAAALERMLRRCRAQGIEPLLVAVPLPSGHRGCYEPAIEADFQAYVRDLTSAYQCRFLDYRAALPDHFFIDHHHASPEGKQVFSRQLGLEVLAPFWTEQARARRAPSQRAGL